MIIKIVARKYKLKLVPFLELNGRACQGICDYKEKSISIATDSVIDPMATLIHEMYHAYVQAVGVDWDNCLTAEYMADLAGSFGAQIIHENGDDFYKKFKKYYFRQTGEKI